MYILEENEPLLSYLSGGIVRGTETEPREPIPVKGGTATVGSLPSVPSGTGTNIPGRVITPPPRSLPSPGPRVPATSVTQPVKYNPTTETVVTQPANKTFSPLVYLAGGGLLLYYLFSKK